METLSARSDRQKLFTRDFNENPFIVIWEVTRACQLHCLHCRANAQRHRHPLELTTEQGMRLIDQIADMDQPLFVFTGGDPLEREDLFDFMRYARGRGLEIGMTPSATPRLTREALAEAKQSGLAQCALSLDGSSSEIHDKFRGTSGSYALTMNALQQMRELGIPIQVNTTVSRYNVDDLAHILDLVESFDAQLWSVFFLIPTGRAKAKDMVSANEAEQVMEWLWQQSQVRTCNIKTTAAPHYRRVILQHRHHGNLLGADFSVSTSGFRAPKGVNDGNGFLFISHTGDVYPSGFLPVVAGNVRQTPLADIYRHSPIFNQLRNSELLKGKCGVCEFRSVCGGSRARAYGMTGDYLESDATCAYIPKQWHGETEL